MILKTLTIPCGPFTIPWRVGMSRTFADLRFRDGQLRPCRYRLESYTEGVSAVVWVELYIGQSRLEMVYGNTAAEDGSTGEIFSEFVDGSEPLDTARWDDLGGVTVADGTITIQGVSSGTRGIRCKTAYDTGYSIRARSTAEQGGSTIGTRIGFGDTLTYMFGALNYSHTYVSASENITVTTDDAYHVYDVIRRLLTRIQFTIDGAAASQHENQVPTGPLYPQITQYNTTTAITVDYVMVRRAPYVEPTITLRYEGLNTYGREAGFNAHVFSLPPDLTSWDVQKIVSWTVRRSASDAMYRAEVEIEGIVPSGTTFNRVQLTHPNPFDETGERDDLVFFGFFPAQRTRIDLAKNTTRFIGYDYGFYLSARHVGAGDMVIPSATNPATWMKSQFEDPGLWFDLSRNPSTDCLFDTSNINTPTFGASLPAREFIFPSKCSAYQACAKVADEIGWLFATRWLDVGEEPSYTHQDPAYRIIRVEAEDFADYSDTTAANEGGAYRDTGVDIEYFPSERGYNVGWIRDGEWLSYSVDIPVAGEWTIRFRTAAPNDPAAGRWFDLSVDGGAAIVPAGRSHSVDEVDTTADYSTFVWNTQELPVTFTKDTHTIKITFGGTGSGDNEHMNLGAFDLVPPPAENPAASLILPAIYFVDEDTMDNEAGTAGSLDLPPKAVIQSYDPTLTGPVDYVENFDQLATAVIVRYRTPTAPDTIVETTAWDETLYIRLGMEMYIDHIEELRTPVTQAVAEAYRDALLEYYSREWGTVTATFINRTDLQLFQLIQFVGHDGVPDDTDFRITDISYKQSLGVCDVNITAIPAEKFAIERRLTRLRAPDEVSEIQTIVESILSLQEAPLTGMSLGSTTGGISVQLDRGGTITASGDATYGARVVCVPTEHHGWVAVVSEA